MSSNIEIQKVCQYCGKEFIAKTTATKYCSHKCNQRHYKERKRAEKINASKNQVVHIDGLKDKEFLSVTEVSKLIGCSRQNVYKMIKTGKLKATNILKKKTIIKRTDLDDLFK